METDSQTSLQRKYIHVVNLGAFTGFDQLCRDFATDLYPADCRVLLHDISSSSVNEAQNGLEPWVHRFSNFDTFIDRLSKVMQQNAGLNVSAPTIHDLILCLPKDRLLELAQADFPASDAAVAHTHIDSDFGPPADIQPRSQPAAAPIAQDSGNPFESRLRAAVKKLNVNEYTGASVVLFAASTSSSRQSSQIGAAMARILEAARDEPLHHSRNGVIVETPDTENANAFLTLRLFVEVMQSDVWNDLRYSSQKSVGKKITNVLAFSVDRLPTLTTGQVIAAVIHDVLEPSTAQAGHETEKDTGALGGELANFLAQTATKLETEVPTGQAKPATTSLEAAPTLALGELGKAVSARGAKTVDTETFLNDLLDWQNQSIETLKIDTKPFNEIDNAIEGFKTHVISTQPQLITAFKAAQKRVETQLSLHESQITTTRARIADLTGSVIKWPLPPQQDARLPHMTALTEFQKTAGVYHTKLASFARGREIVGFLVFCLALWLIAVFAQSLSNANPSAQGWLSPISLVARCDQPDAIYVCSVGKHQFIAFAMSALGLLGMWFWSKKSLESARETLGKASVNLSVALKELIIAEFSARRHALAATRLSGVLAKLKQCKADAGDGELQRLFATKSFDTSAPEWGKTLHQAVKKAYQEDSTTHNPRERVKGTLRKQQYAKDKPEATLTCKLVEFGDDRRKIQHRFCAENLDVTIAPVAPLTGRF